MLLCLLVLYSRCFFFFQAEDGIRDLVRSRGLGDVYKRQALDMPVMIQIHGLVGRQANRRQNLAEERRFHMGLSLIHI